MAETTATTAATNVPKEIDIYPLAGGGAGFIGAGDNGNAQAFVQGGLEGSRPTPNNGWQARAGLLGRVQGIVDSRNTYALQSTLRAYGNLDFGRNHEVQGGVGMGAIVGADTTGRTFAQLFGEVQIKGAYALFGMDPFQPKNWILEAGVRSPGNAATSVNVYLESRGPTLPPLAMLNMSVLIPFKRDK